MRTLGDSKPATEALRENGSGVAGDKLNKGTDAKQRYRILCDTEPTIPIFSRNWWLDAVCGADNWNVALAESGGVITGSLPYAVHRRGPFTLLGQAPLTQKLGPWLRQRHAKYANRLAVEKDVLTALINQLPPFDRFTQSWDYNVTNWLPFYWQGFQQTTQYTYVLGDLSDQERLWSDLRENIRTDVRKAAKRFGIIVRETDDFGEFWHLHQQTFARQSDEVHVSEALARRIDAICAQQGRRKIWVAVDSNGEMHAGAYIVWDDVSAYYLMGGSNPKLRNSGAGSACLWHAIQHASTVTKSFDFEGSMIEPIERYFRAFGARQMPYFRISKTTSTALRVYDMLRSKL